MRTEGREKSNILFVPGKKEERTEKISPHFSDT